MSLVNTTFLGSVFKQDPKPNWIKISGVVMGESQQYGYKVITSFDIGKILDTLYNDPLTKCVVYNWKTGTAYVKKGFDMSNPNDSKIKPEYTTFIPKRATPSPPLPSISLYCMPGSNVIRSAIGSVKPYPLNITLAFWNNNNWDSGEPDATLISVIRSNGGDCTVSFGGYSGCIYNQEPALLGGTVADVVQRYSVPISKYNFAYADFDIEMGKEHDVKSYQLRNSAIVSLQQKYPNLKISFTIPADGNGFYCQDMLIDALNRGVKIDTVRVMLMDFGQSVNMVSTCISGLQKSKAILDSIGLSNVKLGFIPLLLIDDNNINTYTLQNHNDILSQIRNNKMSYVQCYSYWELAIDQKQTFSFLKSYIASNTVQLQ